MTSRIKQEPQMGSTPKLAPSSPRPRKRRPITPPDSADSPTKKTQTPSKAALKRQESAQKKGWKEEWAQWVADSQWEKDHSYEQVPGTCEIHGSDAMTFYLLKEEEIGTLHYHEFPNGYNPRQPGRSYAHENVKNLVYRKHAMPAGLHHQNLEESELLRRGKTMFNENQIKRREKNPKLDPAPKLHLIGMGRSYDDDDDQRMAPGSWTKRVYNGEGKVVGYQRFEQFEQYDEDDFDGSPPPYVPPKDFQHLKMGSKWIERPSWIKMTKYGRYYAD